MTTKKSISISKVVAWATLVISVVWLVKSNYEFEPLLMVIGAVGVISSIYGLEYFNTDVANWKFLKYLKARVNHFGLTVDDIFLILGAETYSDFCAYVKQFGFEQVDANEGERYSKFSFNYSRERRESFLYLENEIRGYSPSNPVKSLSKSFHGFRNETKALIKSRILSLVDQERLRFVHQKENDFQVCSLYEFALDTAEDQIAESSEGLSMKVFYELCENNSEDQYSLSIKYELFDNRNV